MVTVRRNETYRKLVAMKKVGFLGAVALIFNAATGPGLPFTPQSFQSPGYLFTIFCFLLFAVVSGFSIVFIIEAMQAIPANKHFQGNVEYATLINFYFEPAAHVAGQILLYGSLVSNAIQGIILSAQAIDKLLIDIAGKTCGVALSGAKAGWICVDAAGDSPSPFGSTFMLFTFGILVVLILAIPLGMTNLDDIIWVQYVAFAASIIMVLQWVSSPFVAKLPIVNIPAGTRDGKAYGSVVGTVMLNFAVTVIIPSWINLKSKEVNVQQAVWSSIVCVVAFYIVPGALLATGFENLNGNVLTVLLKAGQPAILTKITVYAFAFVMLIPAIPVNLLISKDNLVQNKLVSDRVATFITLVLPWFISIPLQTGELIEVFQTWTSLIFVSASNFIIPILIFFKCKEFRREYNDHHTLSARQLDLLRQIHATSSKILGEIERRHAGLQTQSESAIVVVDPSAAPAHEQMNANAGEGPRRNPGLLSVESSRMLFYTLEDDVPDPDMEDLVFERPTLLKTVKRNFRRNKKQPENNMDVTSDEEGGSVEQIQLPQRVTRRQRPSFEDQQGNEVYQSSDTIIPDPVRPVDIPFLDPADEEVGPVMDQSYRVSRVSRAHANRMKSLPANPKYRSPAFRSVPIWMPFQAASLARVLLVLTKSRWVPDFIVQGILWIVLYIYTPTYTPQQINEIKRNFIQDSKVVATTRSDANSPYELPTEFFEAFLGPQLKYSACYFEPGYSLIDAEERSLELVCKRAGLEDGMSVLDIGCGWGSLSLYIAKNYPNCKITALSPSMKQLGFIRAKSMNLTGTVKTLKSDIESFETMEQFDRVFAVEVMEYMQDYDKVLAKLSALLVPKTGMLFIHSFCHRDIPIRMTAPATDNWITTFFGRGGTLPSQDYFLYFQKNLEYVDHWVLPGDHYAKTFASWRQRMDLHRHQVLKTLNEVYGSYSESYRWYRRWRFCCLLLEQVFRTPQFLIVHYVFKSK